MIRLSAVDGDAGRAAGEVALSGNNLVVVLTELHALGRPSVEVVLHVDASAGALVLADGPVLLEGLGTIDARRICASCGCDLVAGTVGGDGSLDLGLGGGVIAAEVLNDVVLDERVAGPAVDGKVGVAVVLVGSRVGDGARGTSLPALATNSVAARLPADAVLALGTVGVGSLGTVVGPPGVVAAVVHAGGGGSSTTGGELSGGAGSQIGGRGGEGAGGSHSGGDDGGEGDHFEVLSD
jgi:hypothetical protein